MNQTRFYIFSFSLILLVITSIQPVSAKQFKVLLFTKTTEWHHESILDGVTAMRKLSQKHHFDLEWHEDATRINAENLANFDVIVFLCTTGQVLDNEQRESLKGFVQSGKGFVGVHSAADTESQWPWYGKLIGRNFIIHPPVQTAPVKVERRDFYGLEGFQDTFLWTDEWYDFGPENVSGLNYLLSINERDYDTKSDWGDRKGNGMRGFHPLAWFHEFDGGRSFYTSLGHLPESYRDQRFTEHLYGGIFWAATGKRPQP